MILVPWVPISRIDPISSVLPKKKSIFSSSLEKKQVTEALRIFFDDDGNRPDLVHYVVCWLGHGQRVTGDLMITRLRERISLHEVCLFVF